MNIIQILIILIQMVLIARFHFELSAVNIRLEPVNSIRKITNPLVVPLKRLMPTIWMKKAVSIIVAWVLTIIILLFLDAGSIKQIIIFSLLILFNSWLTFLQYGMFLFVIGSWIQIPALQKVNYLLYQVFNPLLRPIQRVIPAIGGLDFSPIIFLFLLSFIASAFSRLVYIGS